MWKFNPFTNSSPASAAAALEGRTVDIGSLKLHVRAAVAEGGFSCVYLARDAACPSRQYALKHIICNDRESLDLAMKEIAVMKLLREHPNVVTLVAHAVFDMGRTKEVLLAMEFCEKSLVAVLDGRGGEYFEEEKVMLIFRDVCNGVRAMHSQTPPIAHRDLKAENVLLGSDGIWKLCDFGSISTNHKCFSRPEEMGLEEDNIRKHTTPAYRAPEMWDLFRREVISEKVDIWALGCLLYRICYLKSAFDGESKLQILNGNYRIPESPKYSDSVTGLIKSMLESSPDARPDIMQVSLCVNEQLPFELRMHLSSTPLSAIGLLIPIAASHEGVPKRTPLMPQRSPPPSSTEHLRNISPPSSASSGGVPIGAFWSTQQAKDSLVGEDKGHLFDKQKTKQNTSVHSQNSSSTRVNPPSKHHNGAGYPLRQSVSGNSSIQFEGGRAKDSDVIFFIDESKNSSQDTKASHLESKQTFQNKAFNALVRELDSSKLKSGGVNDSKPRKEELEAEVDGLKEQLKQVSLEKAEMTSKYENLSAICRSQRQEIQELKRALASASTSPAINDSSKSQMPTVPLKSSTPVQQRETLEGGLWELQQGMFANSLASPSPEPKTWQAFVEEPRAQPMQLAPISNHAGSVWTSSSHGNTIMQPAAAAATIPAHDVWSYGLDSLAWNTVGPQVSRTCFQSNNTSQRFNGSEAKKVETSQPAGWAGF